MKTIKIFLGCLLAFVLCYSCIDDEGNYDYTELTQVTISGIPNNNTVYLGEEYVIDPVIDYGDADSTEFAYTWVSEIQYEWQDTVSTSKELRYTYTELGWYMNTFMVEHIPTGSTTSVQFFFTVSSPYATGWTVLSDENGRSVLSYIQREVAGEDEVVYTPIKDIYTQLWGEDLGTGPVRLGRHYSYEMDEILVIQESGAVEISGLDFSKAITTREEFVGGVYPTGFEPKQAEYASLIDIILGTDGNAYMRATPNTFYPLHLNQYGNVPMFSNAKIAKLFYSITGSYIFAHDELNNRLLGVYNEPQGHTGKVVYLSHCPDSTVNEDFIPMEAMGAGTEIVFMDAYSVDGAGGTVFAQILKKDGNYYYQTYVAAIDQIGGTNYYTFDETSELFVGNDLVNDNSKFCINANARMFFSAGNTLYVWEMTGEPTVFYTFPANVVDMERYAYQERDEIGVGLENGEFYILNSTYEAIYGGEEKVIWQTEGLGRIVDIQYKYDNADTFEKETRR